MTVSKILCLNLFLLLSVHGLEVVARIRFQSSHYIVSEESPSICVAVENMAPPSLEDFAVSYSYDSVLVGLQDEMAMSPSLQGSLRFRAGSSVSNLCFSHMDDDIACEPDIIGHIRLINSSAVIVVEPSIAMVTIEDDDPASIGFQSSSYSYTEDQANTNVIVESSHPSLPITVRIREAQHSGVFVSQSLTVPDTLLPIDSTQETFQLSLHDDEVALEAPELIILELSFSDPQSACSSLELSPYSQTQITIVDNDVVAIGLTESTVTVLESVRSVVVCVRISKRIARALAFRVTTRNGTAKGGEDYGSIDLAGQFMPLSEQTQICYEIPITFDSVVEQTEAFSVHLTMETNLPNEVSQKLSVTNTVTTVNIQDSSNCFRVVLDGAAGGESRQHYVPESTTVCFDCAAYKPMVGGSTSMSVLWLLDGDQLTNNERFSNGYVLSNGTLMITDSSSSFDFQQEATIGCANGLEDTTSVQQEVVNFNVLLGVPPQAISLVSSGPSDSAPQMLTCLYEGVPQPNVEWRLNDKPVTSDQKSVESVVLEEENRYKSVLTLPKEGVTEVSTYACVCRNLFGTSQRTIKLRKKPVSSSISGSTTVTSTGLLILLLVIVVL